MNTPQQNSVHQPRSLQAPSAAGTPSGAASAAVPAPSGAQLPNKLADHTLGSALNFGAGLRMLGTGLGIILRTPKLLLLGVLPALLTCVLLLGALGTLLFFSPDIVSWMTPFANGWDSIWRVSLRVTIGVLLVGGAGLLAAVSFIALTLLIGGPFYDYIAEQAEKKLGLDASEDDSGWWGSVTRDVGDSARALIMALIGAAVIFAIGLIPVVGQIAAPVLGALFGGWMVTLEMVGGVFSRRGLTFRDRRRAMKNYRALGLGFGLPTYLLCWFPVVQLVVVPAAVVGGTLMAHRVLGPTSKGPEQRR